MSEEDRRERILKDLKSVFDYLQINCDKIDFPPGDSKPEDSGRFCPIGTLRLEVGYEETSLPLACTGDCAWARITANKNIVCALVTR